MSEFAWWYYTLSFTSSLHFQWPWHYFKVTAVSSIFDWIFYVLIQLSCNFIRLLSTSSKLWTLPLFFTFAHIQGRFLTYFLIWQKLYRWLFHGHCSSEVFQTLHYDNLAWGLPIHTWFNDLDLVSKSKVCQNHNCK